MSDTPTHVDVIDPADGSKTISILRGNYDPTIHTRPTASEPEHVIDGADQDEPEQPDPATRSKRSTKKSSGD